MRIKLTVVKGPGKGRVFTFDRRDRFIVGRSKMAHFRLPRNDRYFSRIHFLVEVNPPHCRLMDMGSRNGTFVNGQEVHATDLKHGDQIKAGKTVLRVSVVESKGRHTTKPRGDRSLGAPATMQSGTAHPPLPSASDSDVSPPKEPIKPQGISEQRPAATLHLPMPLTPDEIVAMYGSPGVEVPPRRASPDDATKAPARAEPSTDIQAQPTEATVPPSSYATLKPSQAAPVPVKPMLRCRACNGPVIGDGKPRTEGSFPVALAPMCADCQEMIEDQDQEIDDYILVRKLGEGGMGVVSLALRKSDGTLLAVKRITPAVTPEPREIKRFLREARILRELNHPNIVAFREMGCVHDRPYFAMDFVRGIDASRLVKTQGPLPIERAVGLACQLLDALEYAHARDYVHRDIKPHNLLLTEEGGREVVKVADFGLAKIYQASRMSGLTMSGDLGGTIAYMAPEQITNFREAKPEADRYSAAATLYNLLTNRLIYDLPRGIEFQIVKVLQEDPVPIQSRRPDIPSELAAIVHRALSREPKQRFADVREMRKALEPFCR
jgi:serine/threonine-protein kinase